VRKTAVACLFVLSLIPFSAFAALGGPCIQCHTAFELEEMKNPLPYRASIYQEMNTACVPLGGLKEEAFFTENRLLRTDLALRAMGNRPGKLTRETAEFNDTVALADAGPSMEQVFLRLGQIRANVHGVYMELNMARDGARARRAVGSAALLVVALFLMAVMRFRRFTPGKNKALTGMLAAFVLAGVVSASCRAAPPVRDRGREAMAGVIEKGVEMAEHAEAMALRAWQLASIAVQTRRDLSRLMNEAEKAAKGIDREEYMHYAQALRLKSQGWPADMEQRAEQAALRLERAASGAWPLRAVAGELGGVNRGRALRLFKEASGLAREAGDPEYRDAQLRAITTEMARISPSRAAQAASLIETPYYRAWALRAIGGIKGDLKVLRKALLEAEKIVPGDNKERLERDRLLYQKALLIAKTAVAMDRAGANRNRMLDAVDQAVSVAESIGKPYTMAYAYSSIASLLAPVDVPTAAYIASRIGQEYPDAASAARIGIAMEMARRDERAALEELRATLEVAGDIKDLYDRQKTLGRAVYILAGIWPDEALERMFPEKGKPLIEFPLTRSEAVRPALIQKGLEEGKGWQELLDKTEPLVRAEIYTALAEERMGEDWAKGEEYFRKALSAARESESARLPWMIAARWAGHDPDRLSSITAELGEPAPRYSAAAFISLAKELQGAGNREEAIEAYRIALREAMDMKRPFERSEALKEIAGHTRRLDRDLSVEAFKAALEAARQLGAGEGA
jgi:tetratricopeptide (TPR) repeat protein